VLAVVLRALSLAFAAGAVGAVANSLLAWACGRVGLPQAAGVSLAPALTAAWLVPRVTWGGLWGLLFALPGLGRHAWVRGLVLSLAPTAAQLLFFGPRAGAGLFMLGKGTFTPAFVLLFNAAWGLVAAGWLVAAGRPGARA